MAVVVVFAALVFATVIFFGEITTCSVSRAVAVATVMMVFALAVIRRRLGPGPEIRRRKPLPSLRGP